ETRMSVRYRRELVIFSTADWDNPFWTNKQHMAVLFARHGYRVLYVDSLGLRQPMLHAGDLRRMARRLWKSLPFPRQARPNLWRISPLALPFHSHRAVRAFNARLLYATLCWHLRLLNMRRPLVWTYNPVIADLCAALPHSGIVYHCVDDLRAAPHIDAATIARGEERLGRIADLCFATSPALRERMSGLFPRTVLEPNVCDQALFDTARMCLSEPEELRGIPRPRLLFVGALSEYKVDFSLMEAVARRLPEAHWILIGPEGEGQPDSRRPPVLPNVHVLGPRTHGRLPYYMAHADAAVLPTPHNAYTAAMFPMKFFEYLAAGLPVVSSDLPALREFAALCFLTDGEEGFTATLRRVLAGERRDAAAIEAACRRYSWEARFVRMERDIEALQCCSRDGEAVCCL
ncbi:MAG: glycosyltransferase, partial [Desulfovibrionaceae bacterium]|nr:glycosyltransferase [Desulfovibrionaceae bacterium]